ncbi:MAG: efflux transporter periplasmic adaptor subunit, partial [Bacteroidia bacterium]|nr:efflux transporter periplasmic adaptor subunit [Bacteroidia bacterium]
MKSNKILKILLPIVVVLIIFAIIGKKAGWFGKALTVKVAVENAEKRVIVETITANGKIQPEK